MARPALCCALALAVLAALPAQAENGIATLTTPAGITVWHKQEPAIPILALSFAFAGGASLDPAGREGLANMVSVLLDEGAGELDAQAFQTRLDELALKLSFEVGRDDFYGTMTALSDDLDAAFELLALALQEPRFDADAVERMRGQIQISLRRDAQDPAAVAWSGWSEAAFPDHVYGRPVDGTAESVAAIATEDLRRFVEASFTRDRLVIAAVGDVDAERLAALVDRAFAALPARGAALEIPDTSAVTGEIRVIDMDVSQSAIAFGWNGLDRDHPDFYAAFVLNKALGGGGLNNRLAEEIRNERGLAYAVGSFLHVFDHAGLWLGSAATENTRAGETLALIMEIAAEIAADGISERELDDAKAFLTGSFALRLASNAGMARMLLAMQLNRLGADYLERRNGFIEAVTATDVRRVAARLLDPGAMLVVVTGRPEGVAAGRIGE